MALPENKFGKNNDNLAKRLASHEETATIEKQLVRLEDDIRRLKIEYDVFFNGGSKRAPYETKSRVETTIKRISDDRSLTYAQRYHFNSLIARYTAFRELWRRTMKGREEGRDMSHLPPKAQEENPTTGHQTETPKQKATAVANTSTKVVCNDVKSETESVKKLYEALIQAKRQCGEATEGLNFSAFQQHLVAQSDKIMQNLRCDRVSFQIGVENGKVSFKAARG